MENSLVQMIIFSKDYNHLLRIKNLRSDVKTSRKDIFVFIKVSFVPLVLGGRSWDNIYNADLSSVEVFTTYLKFLKHRKRSFTAHFVIIGKHDYLHRPTMSLKERRKVWHSQL